MFSRLVACNRKRNRKDNNLFLSSMIISVISLYVILSLANQDVIIFLRKMESNAIDRLLSMVPVFYGASLFILYFLVYFAGSIMVERRKHEFGVYLTLGMKRSKLIKMLFMEDWRNNLIALGIGIPVAVLLSELISLVTIRIVGLGIIGHRFSLSFSAVIFTILGFFTVKLLIFIVLSGKIVQREIGELLGSIPTGTKKQFSKKIYILSLVIGIIMLAIAYRMGIKGLAWKNISMMGITVFLGITGTILLFFGTRVIISGIIRLGRRKKLHVFNFRQIQEMVIYRSNMAAVCSLLTFVALCLFGTGVAISVTYSQPNTHILDYTFQGSSYDKELNMRTVKSDLSKQNIENRFSKIFEVKTGYPAMSNSLDMSNLLKNIREEGNLKKIRDFLEDLKTYKDCHLISLSGYNELRKAAHKPIVHLKKNEGMLYIGEEFLKHETLINKVLKKNPEISLADETCTLTGKVQYDPIVTDRAITLFLAIIVPDEKFNIYTEGEYSNYINGILNRKFVREKGLMRAIFETNKKLDSSSFKYESYIQNIGRRLVYIVSAGYITIYLAILFLVIANTAIGVQFLMGQQKSHKRYQTLIHLGATYKILCKSAHKQIHWYFGLPIFIALLNSLFGVRSLFTGFLPVEYRLNLRVQMIISAVVIVLLAVVEYIYIKIVKKNSDKYLWTLMSPKREE